MEYLGSKYISSDFASQISSDIKAKVHDNQTSIKELSSPLQATNQAISVVRQQTENVATQVDGIDDGVRTLRKDISSLRRKGFEELEKISKAQTNGQSIENAVVTRLNQHGAEMRNALSQHTEQITGLMTKHTGQTEVFVSCAKYAAIPRSCFAGRKDLEPSCRSDQSARPHAVSM